MTTLTSTRQQVHINSLITDDTIEVDIGPDTSAVRALCAAYDRDRLGVLSVSKRDNGVLVVIDGYVRRWAVLKSENTDAVVDCAVYTGLSHRHERHLRRLLTDEELGDESPPTRVTTVISEDAGSNIASYSLTRIVRLASGHTLRINVDRPYGNYRETQPDASAYLLGRDNMWAQLLTYEPLEWMHTTAALPKNDTEDAADDTSRQTWADQARQFIRDALTPVVDELQHRACALLNKPTQPAPPQLGTTTPPAPR